MHTLPPQSAPENLPSRPPGESRCFHRLGYFVDLVTTSQKPAAAGR
ncbi:MAG: hypothetical protein GU356_11635 [Pyrobaculum sp.]|nr:hypothetical protein [Pyrobaculum sp.]